jgi:hypothetical protein
MSKTALIRLPHTRAALEHARPEALVSLVYRSELPFRGLLEIADYRLAGRLARARAQGRLGGWPGETFVYRTRAPLPYRTVICIGRGDTEASDLRFSVRDYVARAATVVGSMHITSVAIETQATEADQVEDLLIQLSQTQLDATWLLMARPAAQGLSRTSK